MNHVMGLIRKPTADKDLPCSNYIVIRITNIAILIMMTIVTINNMFKNNDNNGNHDNIGIKVNGNIYIYIEIVVILRIVVIRMAWHPSSLHLEPYTLNPKPWNPKP